MSDLSPDDLAMLTEEERQIWEEWHPKPCNCYQKPCPVHEQDNQMLVVLRSLITARRALKKYGTHRWKCNALTRATKVGELAGCSSEETERLLKEIESMPAELPCTCGFEAALRY